MAILCIDGYNFLHRARSGFKLGEYPIVFNFFRNLRSLIEIHNPTRVYFTLEGHSSRYQIMPEYKANRVAKEGTKKHAELLQFNRQKELIVDLLSRHFPVSVVRHSGFEADDTIYNLIKKSSSAVEWVVASTDTDFIQLMDEFPNVKLYNPITKKIVTKPDYDYVTWKALRGDGTDNISGIVTDKVAESLVKDPEKLNSFLADEANKRSFDLNFSLIKFMTWDDPTAMEMTCSTPTQDNVEIARAFDSWGFKSMLKEGTWQKYTATFDRLWGV